MAEMKTIIDSARIECPDVKVMIGGAHVSEKCANEIGADAYTDDASSATEKTLEFCIT